jgi:ABC-type bacteriocin/lantibiotic exporter with double-glycine peptidase domain
MLGTIAVRIHSLRQKRRQQIANNEQPTKLSVGALFNVHDVRAAKVEPTVWGKAAAVILKSFI